ncbi:hypothetical protein HMPREF2531_00409 [Bacteroides intestinalis]|uniref:Uncharacterized protein n=1 Tax=Bacteroides intestinalis TaxID=329854 RepID=A0A139LU07_9BACE|nr:hypothetical protein HMPREF2531_00409 [Bacteroides intestinalis]
MKSGAKVQIAKVKKTIIESKIAFILLLAQCRLNLAGVHFKIKILWERIY